MTQRDIAILLFVMAGLFCCFESLIVVSICDKAVFCYFGLVCVCGIIWRWGVLIPVTLLGFFFGQQLPYRYGYSHNAMESVEHDLIIPTIIATAIVLLLVVFQWMVCEPNASVSSQQTSKESS